MFGHSWDKKVKNQQFKLVDFPELTENELRDLTMGIYQLKKAESYTEEYFDDNVLYDIMAQYDDTIFKAQIWSHHTSRETYNVWI